MPCVRSIQEAKLATESHFTAADWAASDDILAHVRNLKCEAGVHTPLRINYHDAKEREAINCKLPAILCNVLDDWDIQALAPRRLMDICPNVPVAIKGCDDDGAAVHVNMRDMLQYMAEQQDPAVSELQCSVAMETTGTNRPHSQACASSQTHMHTQQSPDTETPTNSYTLRETHTSNALAATHTDLYTQTLHSSTDTTDTPTHTHTTQSTSPTKAIADGGKHYLLDEEPMCVFDGEVLDTELSLRDMYTIPTVPELDFDLGILERLPSELRPTLKWLLLGPPRSGTHIHRDPDGTCAWNAVTSGTKRWVMLEPATPADIAFRDNPPEGEHWTIAEWFEKEWPSICQDALLAGFRAYDLIQHAGEVMYVPDGWYHAVLNIESSVAITHNFLPRRNLERVVNEAVVCPGGGLPDVTQRVVDAFGLVDENGLIARWLNALQQDGILRIHNTINL